MNQYWVLRNGKQSGPYDKALLAASYDKGKLFPADLVSSDGKQNWTPASEVFGLVLALSPVMAPAPATAPPASRPLESPYAPPTARIDRDGSATDDAEVRYAGFWRRFAASILDSLIVMLLAMAAGFAAGLLLAITGMQKSAIGNTGALLGIAAAWLYFALLESGERRATFGKRALQIEVATQDDLEQISFGRATGRYFARILSLLILYIGYLMQPFTERKQALHDMISGTVVVMHGSGSRGLIVLVVILVSFVPMVGILAAIALPAYQDYTIRSQVDDGIHQSQLLRAAVVQHYSTQGSFPPDTAALNLGRPVSSHYVSAITVQNGGIDIEYGNNAHRSIAGKHLGVQVLINTSGEAHFLCGGASAPAGFIIAASSSRPVTDLPNKSLPPSCRTAAGK